MVRLTFVILLLSFGSLSAAVQIRSEGDLTGIDNNVVSITWSDSKRIVTIEQGEAFAKIELPNGQIAAAAQHPAPGRGEHTVIGASLVIRQEEGENGKIEAIFTIFDHNPFVLISKVLNESNFPNGEAIKRLEFPKITLDLPADKHVSLGTAGLRPVDGHKGSYMFLAVANPDDRSGVVSGWITSRQGSGIVFSEKNAEGKTILKPVIEYGKLLPPKDFQNTNDNLTEVFVLGRFDDCRFGLERYAWQVARTYHIKMKPPLAGYCTWYADKFGKACNEKEIINLTNAAAEKLSPYGFNFVQIDDKWQDGMTNVPGPRKNFLRVDPKGPYPNGMTSTADYIRSKDMKAGIWLIPFAGSDEDPHWNPDFFLKSSVTDEVDEKGKPKLPNKRIANKKGEPFLTQWTGTSLDLTNPAAQEYLYKEIEQMAKDWHYNYFKLDGSNAGLGVENVYVNNEYKEDYFGEAVSKNPEITPVAAHRLGFEIIREAAGEDAFLLGCNVSQNMRIMGASFGCVDAMRIGPDNGSNWKSLKEGPWHGTNRYFFNGRVWWNDPDPVYVRDSMPVEHARLIATWVSISGQLFAFSDWLPSLSEERVEILRRTIRPHGLVSARPVDFFNEDLPKIWHLSTQFYRQEGFGDRDRSASYPERDIIAFYNWDDKKPIKIETPAAWIGLRADEKYVAFDYWNNKFFGSFEDKLSVEVPAGSCLVLAVQAVRNHPVLLSTSQHVTQGIVDVVDVSWDSKTKTLSGTSRVIANDPYELRIYDPETKDIRREMFRPEETSNDFKWNVKF